MAMAHSNIRSMFVGITVLSLCGLGGLTAQAGTILLSRESTIRATGTAGSGDYNLLDGSQDFNGFADLVDTADAGLACPRVSANQHSSPSLSDSSVFTGAFAEGSVSTEVGNDSSAAAKSEASSNFDLTFQVLGVPSMVSFGGSVGVSGSGSTTVSLSNESTGEILLEQEVIAGAGEGQSIEHSSVLQPGVYELSFKALVSGDPSDSSAYYSFSLSLAPADGPTPISLPPALWSAIGVIGAGGVFQGLTKMRRSIR
jgi:hypothetical protein